MDIWFGTRATRSLRFRCGFRAALDRLKTTRNIVTAGEQFFSLCAHSARVPAITFQQDNGVKSNSISWYNGLLVSIIFPRERHACFTRARTRFRAKGSSAFVFDLSENTTTPIDFYR